MGMPCSTHGSEAECKQIFGGKAGRKETTTKTETQVGGKFLGISDRWGIHSLTEQRLVFQFDACEVCECAGLYIVMC
jgi:hypothetical protein